MQYETNNLESSEQSFIQAIETGARGNRAGDMAEAYMGLALIKQAQGSLSNLRETFLIADELIHGNKLQATAYFARVKAYQIRILVSRGELDFATECLRERNLSADDDPNAWWEIEYLALARLLIAKGRQEPSTGYNQSASYLLDNLREKAEYSGRFGNTVEILTLKAITEQIDGNESEAIGLLERAIGYSAKEGFIRTFVDLGEPMARLLEIASKAKEGMSSEYVSELQAAFHMKPSPASIPQSPQQNELAEPLSDREVEVLKLLVEGKPNRIIAAELFVSVNTVKTHIKNIYGKLQVNGRAQAIARASQLGTF